MSEGVGWVISNKSDHLETIKLWSVAATLEQSNGEGTGDVNSTRVLQL